MDLLKQLLLGVGTFALMVVVASFIGTITTVLGDIAIERQQARERDKRGE